MMDWTRSKVCFSPRGMAHVTNTARADVMSHALTLTDDILHGATCVGERTYADDGPLIDKRHFTFTPIFGRDRWRFLRQPATARGATGGTYERLEVKRLLHDAELERLETTSGVHAAVMTGRSITAIVEGDGFRLAFPVRTMNVETDRWQIDAGPILIPSPNGATGIDDLRIGYLVASSLRPDIHVMSDDVGHRTMARVKRETYAVKGTLTLHGD
jgi:hypothetical protein